MTTDGEQWHIVEAKREDGADAIFRIREVAPKQELTRIFVIEWPYTVTELSRLPNAAGYRKLAAFEEQWLVPAANALGWTFVASKTEDGSFFLYLYGEGDPNLMIERLSPFDGALGFFDDHDPDWEEYGELSVLLERAKAIPKDGSGAEPGAKTAKTKPTKPAKARAKTTKMKKPRSAKPTKKTTKITKTTKTKPTKATPKPEAKRRGR